MSVTVFVGASVDGFIARPDGGLDWLPTGETEDHGYSKLMAETDALVMGRKTFETVLGFGPWPYGTKRVVVLSTKPVDLSRVRDGNVAWMSGTPTEIVETLAKTGAKRLYVDGGDTIQRFLRAGLVDRLIVTRVPVLIGQGIPLFGGLPTDVRLRHASTRTFASGLVQTEYAVIRCPHGFGGAEASSHGAFAPACRPSPSRPTQLESRRSPSTGPTRSTP
jgi:dihydrofolate reductase